MNVKLINIIASVLLFGTLVQAQDKQTLDILVSKGLITRAEADVVAKNSVSISPQSKKTKSIKLIGRVQTQYEYISVDETHGGTENSLSTKSDFIMRRMFLGMNADLGAGWSATVIADFGRSSDNYLEYAYISKKLDWEFLNGTADFGYKKTKFALEEYTSASKLLTIERSPATRYFTEGNNGRRIGLGGRHTGIYWSGKIPEIDGIEYGASITNSFNNSPISIPENADNSPLFCANISYSADFDDAEIQFGINGAYTDGMNVAGTAGAEYGSVYGVNPYVKASVLGAEIWADFLMAKMADGRNSYSENALPMGLNIAAEYKFDIGEFGKLAPAIRYSWLDTDGRGVKISDGIRNATGLTTYDSIQSVYAGLNWYINGNDLKFQIGYEWAQASGAPYGAIADGHSDANAVRAQLQVLF